ncbi:MAG: hypothetical protein QXI58_07125, partial [Candidatus Micrarchaeia archaeon]
MGKDERIERIKARIENKIETKVGMNGLVSANVLLEDKLEKLEKANDDEKVKIIREIGNMGREAIKAAVILRKYAKDEN